MSLKMIRQTLFISGEVDVVNYKRTDVPDYLSAAQRLLNVEIGTTGLAKKRRGTQFLTNVSAYAETDSQLYEYQDKFGNYFLFLSANLAMHIFTITGDIVAFHQTVVTPYTSAQLQDIDYALDNDNLILASKDHPPARIYISNYTGNVFSYQVLNIYPYPAYDFGTIDYNNFTVALSAAGNVLTFQFTGVGANPGFTSAWIGGQIIGGGATPEAPIGYAIITNVSYGGGGGGTVTFTANIQIPFETNPGDYSVVGSQYSVRQPSWSATLGFPSKTLFYQNRLWFANSQTLSNTIFGSKINAPVNFDVGIGRDTDAIIYTIGQTGSGQILWLNGGKQLEIYTQNFEFACPQEQNIALTPSTFSIRQQSGYGSSPNIKPVTYLNDSYYVTRTGKAIINFHYNGIGQTYTSTNISFHSEHLVKSPKNRALLRGTDVSQDNYVYYLNSDASLTTFQFANEYKLAALTPMSFQGEDDILTEDGEAITTESEEPLLTETLADTITVLDLVSINNEIYFLKYYNFTEEYGLEKFHSTIKLDSFITAQMDDTGYINGLDQYNGYVVTVLYNNQDYGQYLVINGEIVVNNPLDSEGVVYVGIIYDVEITPMYIFSGASQSNFYKQITRIYVDYYNSLDFEINGTLVPYQTFDDIQAGLTLVPKTGTAIVDPVLGWNRFQTFSITQSSPFDLQILAIAYEVDDALI
jgi:hypothetical protein